MSDGTPAISPAQASGREGIDAVRAMEPALRRYFLRRVRAQDADDLIQEVYVALQARRSTTPVEDWQRYLFTVANNVLSQFWARQARLPTQSLEPVHTQRVTDVAADHVCQERERLDRAMRVILALPATTRDVFVMHRFDDMTYERIAAAHGISVSMVEKHIMAALRALLAAETDR